MNKLQIKQEIKLLQQKLDNLKKTNKLNDEPSPSVIAAKLALDYFKQYPERLNETTNYTATNIANSLLKLAQDKYLYDHKKDTIAAAIRHRRYWIQAQQLDWTDFND